MNLMENIILGLWMSREIPHSMTIYFILGLFIKSSVTSDYNEPSVSVTHVLRMISYLSALCALRPPRLGGGRGWGKLHRVQKHSGGFAQALKKEQKQMAGKKKSDFLFEARSTRRAAQRKNTAGRQRAESRQSEPHKDVLSF